MDTVSTKTLAKIKAASKTNQPKAAAVTKPSQTVLPLATAAKTPAKSIVGSTRPIPATVDPLLVTILSWRRGHGSKNEGKFCDTLYAMLETKLAKAKGAKLSRMSSARNIVFELPDSNGRMTDVLFSCHVDTTDKTPWVNDVDPQKVVYDPNFGHLFLDAKDKSAGECLGADDGVGVWIMLKMIDAGVPGSYVFHRGEEQGGIGARTMLKECGDFLKLHNAAVAFDRPNDFEVITHQGGQECASDKFGAALAKAINAADDEFDFRTSHNGVFTDTKVYRGVIAECVNLGVGYLEQHKTTETLDYAHAEALMRACCKLDWQSLPIDRDPTKAVEYDDTWGYKGEWHGGALYGAYSGKAAKLPPAPAPKKAKPIEPTLDDELAGMTMDDLTYWFEAEPLEAVKAFIKLRADLAAEKARNDALMQFIDIQ